MTARVGLVALLLVLVAGCGARNVEPEDTPAAGTMPADFVGEVAYANGSVPPPYHYEWRVEFDTSTARLTWTPGYEDTEEKWTEEVDFGPEDRRAYYDRIRQTGLFEFDDRDDGMVGGATGSARFGDPAGDLHDSGTLGTSEAGADMLKDVAAATKEIFPARVWTEMADKQQAWEDAHPR